MDMSVKNAPCLTTSAMDFVYVDFKTVCSVAQVVLHVIPVLILCLLVFPLKDVLLLHHLGSHVVLPTAGFASLQHYARYVQLVIH